MELPLRPSQKDIDDTKAANPGTDVHSIFEAKLEVECLFRRPPPGEWKRFREMLINPDTKVMANKSLVYACRLWPEKAVFEELVDQREGYPGLVDTFTGKLCEIAGVSEAVVAKKL